MKISGQDKDRAVAAVFYTAFMIEMLIFLVDQSDFLNPFEGRLFQITFLLFGFKVFMTRYSAREWILIFAFGVLGGISYFATDRNEIIRVVMMVAASKNIKGRSVMKLTFLFLAVGTILIMGLSILGIFGNRVLIANYGRGGLETRYCFGFGHPNALHCIAWSLSLLGMYLYLKKMKWYLFVLLFAANIGLGILTTSRAGIIITAVGILFGAFIKYSEALKSCKIIYIIFLLALTGAIIFTLAAAVYSTELKPLEWIDRYLNNRILLSEDWGGVDKWTLFGSPENTKYFDMGFMRIFYWYGIVFGILYTALNLLMAGFFCRKQDRVALLVMLMVTIYTVVEAYAISVYLPRNYIFLLLLGAWGAVFHADQGEERYVWGLLPFRKG